MAVYDYKRYKVAIASDSSKTQGLQTGDIVRRQYFDGTNLIYSLMCVLDYGVDQVTNVDSNEIEESSYFIGALIEGDAPVTGEILDFARITNLFNLDRSGALYLTGSDEDAPYMDVIDNIGRNCSLCWPENIANTDYIDTTAQYVVLNDNVVDASYAASETECDRVCHITIQDGYNSEAVGIRQDFYQYVENPNQVLISYKVKATRDITATVSIEYADGLRTDGSLEVAVGTDWEYKFHAITVEWSGRHLRSMQLSTESLIAGDELSISELNIILLSSVSSFQDASQIRIGKLDGVNDSVFGQLTGYGAHLKKLYASQSAHISGTLTAGDENGFASTFYAGKIHRNVFVNSIDVNWVDSVVISESVANPTGVGYVYAIEGDTTMIAQTADWLSANVGVIHTLSFWIYPENYGQLTVLQNSKSVGVVQIAASQVGSWQRYQMSFELQQPIDDGDSLTLTISPSFSDEDFGDGASDLWYFTAPQLESGDYISQYQPTDEILNETDEYGAWFNRGGIGGTIQNPLLQLNYDGNGSIGTRSKSFMLYMDGSGYLANMNIQWDATGKVTFGSNVTLNWDNLGEDVQTEIVSKSIDIIGADTFTITGEISDNLSSCSPSEILLTLQEQNISSTSSQREWSYLTNGSYVPIDGANGTTLTILPDGEYWGAESALSIKCTVTIGSATYSDIITLKKQYVSGYAVSVVSEQGESFKNGQVQTTLTATVSYNGITLSAEDVQKGFSLLWKKYTLPDTTTEVANWWVETEDDDGNVIQEEIDRTQNSITLNYVLSDQDKFDCELHSND